METVPASVRFSEFGVAVADLIRAGRGLPGETRTLSRQAGWSAAGWRRVACWPVFREVGLALRLRRGRVRAVRPAASRTTRADIFLKRLVCMEVSRLRKQWFRVVKHDRRTGWAKRQITAFFVQGKASDEKQQKTFPLVKILDHFRLPRHSHGLVGPGERIGQSSTILRLHERGTPSERQNRG